MDEVPAVRFTQLVPSATVDAAGIGWMSLH